jgi:hypothetical protein
MIATRLRVWALTALFAVVPCVCRPALADLTVLDVVEQVSQANYTHYLDEVLYTGLGDNRGFGPEHDLARTKIHSEFESFGLETSLDPFYYSGGTYYNVVGVHSGSDRPDDIYVVGAHYDSVNNPGADDNASGTAAVMEAARVLSQYEFEATLVFIAFDREEQGMRGSNAYVAEHVTDNILGMVSMDMVAYSASGRFKRARVYGRQTSAALKQSLVEAVSLYGNGISAVDSGSLSQSDHDPFERAGFQACLFIEYDVWDNPCLHRMCDSVDTPDYIDYEFATNMTRSAVGFLATSAVLIPEPCTVLLLGIGSVALLRRRAAP